MKWLHNTKYIYFTVGILLLSLGISLSIHSNFGTSPFDAVLVGLSVKVGLTVGSWEIIIALLMILCNSLLTRHRPEFLGLLTAVITGIGIDLWLFLLHFSMTPELLISKLIYFGIGLLVIGVGTAIYLHANFAPIPVDRFMLIIRDLTGRSILFSRTIIYILFLIMAIVLNGPIGIGTMLTVCLGGPILNFFMSLIERRANNVPVEI